MAENGKKQIDKKNNFALLHLTGALMVTWGHSFALLRVSAPGMFGDAVHGIGLYILMSISGFLVMNSLQRSKHMHTFYWKRISRLYPSLVLTLLLSVIILAFISTASGKAYWNSALYYVKHNLALDPIYRIRGVFKDNPYAEAINGSLWSLCYEVLFYIAMPLLYLPLRWGGNKSLLRSMYAGAVYVGVVIWAVFFRPDTSIKLLAWSFSLEQIAHLGAFFAGGIFYSQLPDHICRKICRPEVVVIILWLLLCKGGTFNRYWDYLWLPYLTVTLALYGTKLATAFFNKWDIAYEIYLLSFPVQQLWIYELYVKRQVALTPQMVFGLTVLVVIPLGIVIRKVGKMLYNLCGMAIRNVINRRMEKREIY